MNPVLEKLNKVGIVPVVVINNVEDAAPLAKALCAGGLPCAEVTFRTAAAKEAIKIMTETCPEMIVGAGTVLNAEQVDAAVEAGATFIVSPGLNPNTVKYCQKIGVPITPGTSSPTDIEQAIELGLDVVKFFPAEQSGGLAKIKAMAAPYVNMKFMPTGGISAKNINEYLSFNKIIACGGSWMVPAKLVDEKKFDEIEKLTREAVQTMLGFEIRHIGINAADLNDANATADVLSGMFSLAKKEGNSSIFVGTAFEVMKSPYLGKMGHIAIGTNYIHRAIAYMENLGVEFDPETAKYDAKGNMVAIYVKGEVAGYALHLVQK